MFQESKFISVAAADYAAFADNSVATVLAIGLVFDLGSGRDIYAAVVSRGTPTYASASDLKITFGILQD